MEFWGASLASKINFIVIMVQWYMESIGSDPINYNFVIYQQTVGIYQQTIGI